MSVEKFRLFSNGRIASAESAEFLSEDVLVDASGKIVARGKGFDLPTDLDVIDCAGCLLIPGMFDVHVHAREPGQEQKETLVSCSQAALAGGVTACVLMPDTAPPIDTGNLVKSAMDLVFEQSLIPMFQAGCLTKGRDGKEMSGYSGMAARGVPMLTDADRSVPCPYLMRRCMEYAMDFDLLVTSHCDTPALTKGGAIHEGLTSYRLGLPGIPAMSQEIAIDRDIRIAQHTGCRLHLQQISTAHGLKSVQIAKEEGSAITCEVSPHHLVLTDASIRDYNTHFKFDPPLRSAADSEALLQGFLDGSIDVLACDHAPHTEFEKSSEFISAPFGAAGLETAVLVIFDRFIRRGIFGWDLLIERYSNAPRRLVGRECVTIREGEKAEFFVFDEKGETRVAAHAMRTKGPVSPFLGETLAGQIRGTALGSCWYPKG